MNNDIKVERPLANKTNKSWFFEQAVYDENGLCGSLKAGQGSGNIPKVIENNLKLELCKSLIENNQVEEYDVVKHSYTNQIMSGNKKCVEKSDGIMITLTTRGDCVVVCVKGDYDFMNEEIEPKVVAGIGERTSNGGSQFFQQNRIYSVETVSLALQASLPGGSYKFLISNEEEHTNFRLFGNSDLELIAIDKENNKLAFRNIVTGEIIVKPNLRIRKLTPKECFKLMGVKEEDYAKIAKNQSDSSLYHLAGDSITTNCLMGLFGSVLNVNYQEKIDDLVAAISN